MTFTPSIYLLGDHFGRQSRDSAGLAVRLHSRIDQLRPDGLNLVYDLTVDGLLRDTLRATSSMTGGTGIAVVFAGASDSRGGGPPPATFIAGLRAIVSLCHFHGRRVVIVIPPPAPAEVKPIRGYAKGSRRWLRRIPGEVHKAFEGTDVVVLTPSIPDSEWVDQLSLKPSGVALLADLLADVLLPLV